MYDLHHPLLVERLAEAARRGVRVRALLEGSWSDGIRDDQKWGAQVLHDAGAEVRWLIKDEGTGIRGRYWLDHAKYGIIDGERVFVQSENFARHGMPSDPSVGNRGWGVVVQDSLVGEYMTAVFDHDWNPAVAESRAFTPDDPAYGGPPQGFVPPDPALPGGSYPAPFPAITVRGARVTPVLAPDHSLLQSRGVIGMIRSARRTLLVEQQYIHLHWGDDQRGTLAGTPNLYLQEVLAAARRGVQVRVLVGDHFLDPANPRDSTHTVEYLNNVARAEGLDLQARVVNSAVARLDKVHNKGVIVDGESVLVSSINWSGTSPRFNREAGLMIEHPAMAQYYTDIFYYDWYNGSPPDYPTITQVMPGEYVQLYNAAQTAVALEGWRLRSAGAHWVFPADAAIGPGQALVLTADGRAFELNFGRKADLIGFNLGLKQGGGFLQLEDPDGTIVDAVAWGGGQPGWDLIPAADSALCRPDPAQDTNTRLDWRAGRPLPQAAGCGGAVER